MCRSFIAIFALHFFLSASAFAFADAGNTRVAQDGAVAVLQAAPLGPQDAALHGTGQAESAMDTAPLDEVADLPDSLPRLAATQRPPIDGGAAIGYRTRAVLPPSLDGLLRPPQQVAPTA